MSKQLSLFPDKTGNWSEKDGKVTINPVPFVDEVEDLIKLSVNLITMNQLSQLRKEWKFVYDFILEELEEYREACERGDIVEVLDALCDITYVSLGNGAMLHGLKDKIWPAYQEVQASNMSKACTTEEEAILSVSKRVRSKVRPVILKKLRKDGTLSTVQETEK